MSRSKSHYYRSRLLRERIRRDERTVPASPAGATSDAADDTFVLPDYFTSPYPGEHLDDDQGRYPRVVLWDEVV
ncbi:hypothetical protein [Marinobacterium rhizophilum]|uniref:Uncharacterized protein n=1 Tax=Marinobacterium rhizophilum TaxID=420402 RepID=A0ABY5HLR6_9GAMM|nr:hypothetical protein [Marinobacterium rhizophilum]UTW12197.1 hypothetical protein KDW95_00440 [Marinobacterium rhizophilum]